MHVYWRTLGRRFGFIGLDDIHTRTNVVKVKIFIELETTYVDAVPRILSLKVIEQRKRAEPRQNTGHRRVESHFYNSLPESISIKPSHKKNRRENKDIFLWWRGRSLLSKLGRCGPYVPVTGQENVTGWHFKLPFQLYFLVKPPRKATSHAWTPLDAPRRTATGTVPCISKSTQCVKLDENGKHKTKRVKSSF